MTTVGAERQPRLDDNLLLNFRRLHRTLMIRNDFFEKGSLQQPPLGTNYIESYKREMERNAQHFPPAYREAFLDPMCKGDNLTKIVTALTGGNPDYPAYGYNWLLEWNLTVLLNAALQTGAEGEIGDDVGSMFAVTSDIYRSFIPAWNQLNAKVSLVSLPPLVSFTHFNLRFSPETSVPAAPCTLDVDFLAKISKTLKTKDDFKVGVVSLPSGLRNHPIFWGILAHEVGGHNVLHADNDDTMLRELKNQIKRTVRKVAADVASEQSRALELIWDNWAEEAISDVCAVLNLGPFYCLGALLYYTTMYNLSFTPRQPRDWDTYHHGPVLANKIRRVSAGDQEIFVDETHPVPILIPHLLLGATQELISLKSEVKNRYMLQITTLARECTGGKNTVDLSTLKFELTNSTATKTHMQVLAKPLPLAAMQTIAYEVGRCIASAPLETSLKGSSLRDLETWDDSDETIAQTVASRLEKGLEIQDDLKSIGGTPMEEAQMLAGSIFAAIRSQSNYDHVNRSLRNALKKSYPVRYFSFQSNRKAKHNSAPRLKLPSTINSSEGNIDPERASPLEKS